MQSYKDEQLIATQLGTIDELTKAMPADATHYVIGRLPTAGAEVVINGLTFVVERANLDAGRLRLRLKRPPKQR